MNRSGRLGVALSLLGAALACPAASTPQRAVSINLCTDILLLEVAAPAQIAALTTLSRDPAMSPYAGEAMHFPVNRGQVEELLQLRPDLVVTTTGAATPTVRLLRELGLRVETFAAPSSVADIINALERLGAMLDRTPRASALINALRAADPEPTGSAWVLQAGGHTPGNTTLAGALLKASGLRDLAAETGFGGGGFVPLEQLVLSRADYLITPRPAAGGYSMAERFLEHPAMAHSSARRVEFDESLWACGGAYFAQAVTRLRQTLRAP